jgi:predicted MFS family arabinose efflux permease
MKKAIRIIPYLLVLGVSLVLLVMVGIGDAYRVYPQMNADKLASLGEVVQGSLNSYLNSGLPVHQFVGFDPLTAPLLQSEKSIYNLQVKNSRGEIVFSASGAAAIDQKALYRESDLQSAKQREPDNALAYEIEESEDFYRIVFPLRNKFELAGSLELFSLKSDVNNRISKIFFPIWIITAIILIVFAFFLSFQLSGKNRKFRIQLVYSLLYIILAISTLFVLVQFYSFGIRDKTQALANSLGQRLNSAIELDLEFKDFSGIDEVLNEYKHINPDISFIMVSDSDKIKLHTNDLQVDKMYQSSNSDFEYDVPLGLDKDKLNLKVGVGIPKKIIYLQLLRSAKNFIMLFLASTFIAFLFLNMLLSTGQTRDDYTPKDISSIKLERIKPFYFLVVFVEGLFVSFLPQFFQSQATAAGLDRSSASMLFTIYFASFVISLIPSGRFADKRGVKPLFAVGAALMSVSYVLMSFAGTYSFLIICRIAAGLGQGIVFIATQSFILKTASKNEKTRGTSIIVLGYNGGMISGTAIGSLLVIYLGFKGVFIVASVISIGVLLYGIFLIPAITINTHTLKEDSMFKNLGAVFKDFEFVKTILFVGIITKSIMTGVNGFALPLVLSNLNYLQEDIGQILIFYSAAVLISTRTISKIADKIGKTGIILLIGTQIGGLALFLIGLSGQDIFGLQSSPMLRTVFLIGSIFLLGLSHGFIHAPIVTHIAETRVAAKVGVSSTTSLYRFLERIGHVSGPVIVGQLLYGMNMSSFSISWIGIAAIVSGLLFAIGDVSSKKGEAK